MDGGQVIPDAIRELLEKRATYQDWLSRLDELGGEFRPEVATKVRTDYAGRLAAVEGELEGHRAELESALADRTATVEELASQHDARSAELEETQLRHVVGEFDDAEWDRRRVEHQSGIDEIEVRLNEQRAAVGSLQKVLSELTGAAAAGAGAVAEFVDAEPPIPVELAESVEAWTGAEADESVEPDTAAEDESGTRSADGTVEDEAPWMTQPFDEENVVEPAVEEFAVDDVVETPESEAVQQVEAEAVEPAEEMAEPAEPDEPAEFMDELEFLESLSLDDTESFDAVSAMLDEEEGGSETDGETGRKTEGP